MLYYLVCGGAGVRGQLPAGAQVTNFRYTAQSKQYTIEGVDDAREFTKLEEALRKVGFSQEVSHVCMTRCL